MMIYLKTSYSLLIVLVYGSSVLPQKCDLLPVGNP